MTDLSTTQTKTSQRFIQNKPGPMSSAPLTSAQNSKDSFHQYNILHIPSNEEGVDDHGVSEY